MIFGTPLKRSLYGTIGRSFTRSRDVVLQTGPASEDFVWLSDVLEPYLGHHVELRMWIGDGYEPAIKLRGPVRHRCSRAEGDRLRGRPDYGIGYDQADVARWTERWYVVGGEGDQGDRFISDLWRPMYADLAPRPFHLEIDAQDASGVLAMYGDVSIDPDNRDDAAIRLASGSLMSVSDTLRAYGFTERRVHAPDTRPNMRLTATGRHQTEVDEKLGGFRWRREDCMVMHVDGPQVNCATIDGRPASTLARLLDGCRGVVLLERIDG